MARIRMIFALIFAAVAFVLTLVAFLGNNPHASSLKHVYYLKIETSDLQKLENTASNLLSSGESALGNLLKRADSNSTPTFTLGASGYCIDFDKCYQPNTPFFFNFQEAVQSFAGVQIPDDISKYQSELKAGGIALWIMLVIAIAGTIVSAAIGVLMFLTSCCSKVGYIARLPATLTVALSTISTIAAFGGALTATGMYAVVKSKFNDVSGDLTLKAHVGILGIVITWIGFLFSLFSTGLWSSAAKSTRQQILYAPAMAPTPMAAQAPYEGPASYHSSAAYNSPAPYNSPGPYDNHNHNHEPAPYNGPVHYYG